MCDLDRIDLSLVERLRDRLDVIDAILMADCVHPVAQSDVLNVELGGDRVEGHRMSPQVD